MKEIIHDQEIETITNKEGNYLICLKKDCFLPNPTNYDIILSTFKGYDVIYTGISDNLKTRYKKHFVYENASSSTVQLSIGSLFEYKKFIKNSKSKKKRYIFNDSDSEKLKKWINDNCLFFFEEESNSFTREVELINKYNPPLNLDLNSNIVNESFRSNLSLLRLKNREKVNINN